MKKLLGILVLGLLWCNVGNAGIKEPGTDDKILNLLQEGKKLIFIRHAIAPGNGDPDNFNIKDCSTQRNLDKKGIQQSKKIGLFFTNNKIKIDKILSSEWCRCKDTAKIAFKNFETFDALNSFYDERFAANEAKQIEDLKKYIKNWNSDKNLVLITHFVVISSILNAGTSSGEIIISDKNFNIIGSFNTM
jgi:phosphohistidine phosphatase SixA